jgi:ubiquinone/menaquinone biosynthesis C-methylase UbiE
MYSAIDCESSFIRFPTTTLRQLVSDHKEIQSFYDSVYYKDADVGVKVSKHLRRLARRIGIRPGMRVLDVACGTGAWLMSVSECGGIPSGIDLSEKAIAICRKNMPDGDFHSGPAESLPFTDDRFDIVTCLGSLEHFLDPVEALREMARVASTDAIFIILVPNSGFLTRRLGLYRGTHQTAAKEEVRSLHEWERLFLSAGLEFTKRWKDLHVLSWSWIVSRGWRRAPVRALQGLALFFWPLAWQYQVYHSLRKRTVLPVRS